jgi:hypothetical protein
MFLSVNAARLARSRPVPASHREAASAGSVRGTIDPSQARRALTSDATLSRPSWCAPMPFIVSHHRAPIAPCPERPAPTASCDATLPPRITLASDPCAFCRSIRDALRGTSLPVTSLRSCRVGVTRMRNPVSRRSLLSPLPRSSPPREGSSTALSIRSSPVRAQPRLDRARAPRGTRAAAIPVRSTDICNPQDLFSTTSPWSRCVPNRVAHAIRELPVLRRPPASAIRALPSSRFCAPRYFLRVTPHGVPLTSLVAFAASDRDEPRARLLAMSSEPIFVAPRERSRRGNRLRTSFTLSRLPPRPTNRPKRVALDRSSRTIARATQEELLQRFTDPRALLRASSPRLSRAGQRAAEA